MNIKRCYHPIQRDIGYGQNCVNLKLPYKKIGSLPLADDELATDEEVFRLVDDAGIALEQRLRAMGVFIADFNNMNLGLTSLMDLLK